MPILLNLINLSKKKARERKAVYFHLIDLREFGLGNYQQIDDKPYGGGKGMVLMSKPLFGAIDYATNLMGNSSNINVIFPNTSGSKWDQEEAKRVSRFSKTILICGHYKGIDQRVIDKYVTHEYSIGDFVLTSGAIPAMIIIDSSVRLMSKALNSPESSETDSFTHGLLDHPHYTYPREIAGLKVPDVLLTGHHGDIIKWRLNKRESVTKKKRIDLWKIYKNKLKKSELNYE